MCPLVVGSINVQTIQKIIDRSHALDVPRNWHVLASPIADF
jgi:hypothetical protein